MLLPRGCFVGVVRILRFAQDDISSRGGLLVILSAAKDLNHALDATTRLRSTAR
jgi:hypothetical protein